MFMLIGLSGTWVPNLSYPLLSKKTKACMKFTHQEIKVGKQGKMNARKWYISVK